MKTKFLILMIGIVLTVAFSAIHSFAGEVEILVNKLVEKEILNPVEAQIIMDETKQTVANELAQGKSVSVPGWVQKMAFKGDLRLRYQWNKKEAKVERHRGRYRFRLGAKANVVDKVKVGFGFCSGGTDPRSTNQTMRNTFETPDLRLDYAYMQWSPKAWLDFYGGKSKRKAIIRQNSDLLWDSDINIEGGAFVINKSCGMKTDLLLSFGSLVLDESSSDISDPVIYFGQAGINWKIGNSFSLKPAIAFYDAYNVKGDLLDHSEETNSLDSNDCLIYDYNVVNPELELAVKTSCSNVPYFALFGGYASNLDPDEDNEGYLFGLKFGDKKVKKKGQWQFKYSCRQLEKDAWLDTFSDSDFYGGKTGVTGSEAILQYALAKNVILGFDYYCTEKINVPVVTEEILQVDLLLKF
ncbi:putative porin [bacterium]|nr:putative porin [bacterium]